MKQKLQPTLKSQNQTHRSAFLLPRHPTKSTSRGAARSSPEMSRTCFVCSSDRPLSRGSSLRTARSASTEKTSSAIFRTGPRSLSSGPRAADRVACRGMITDSCDGIVRAWAEWLRRVRATRGECRRGNRRMDFDLRAPRGGCSDFEEWGKSNRLRDGHPRVRRSRYTPTAEKEGWWGGGQLVTHQHSRPSSFSLERTRREPRHTNSRVFHIVGRFLQSGPSASCRSRRLFRLGAKISAGGAAFPQ